MEQKKDNTKLIILLLVVFLGLPFVVGCVGILAAIAIPAFLRYIRVSKTTEAASITRMMSSTVEMGYLEMCKFPEALPPTFDPTSAECCGGKKCLPSGPLPEYWALNMSSLEQPNYFSYSAVPGPDDTFVITAMADLSCGGPAHTETIVLKSTGEEQGCSITAAPSVVTFEFE